MIGTSFSHYRVVRKLGEGGMGEVFLAEDVRLERNVAIKFLPIHIAGDAHALERFHREAKAAAAMSHPNIVAIHEVGVHDEQPYIAMAYVEGSTLTELMRGNRLPVRRAVDIASQVCDGLDEAHRNGIVHRDIKPGNIHVDRHGRVRILDFGLALRPSLEKITREDMAVGTVHYMSPEQATGAPVDSRSDIFSLGAVLYEMLTGRAPFDGPHAAAVVYSIARESPRPVREVNPSVGPELAAVVDRALEKDPQRRFTSAKDMLVALKSAGGSAARLERSRRRHRRTVTIVAVTAVATVAALRILPKLFPAERAVAETLAVLPFQNLSGDPTQDYFVDGMTDAITTRLAQIKDLHVTSKTSAMKYKNTGKTLTEIANELQVSKIVEGTVIRDGNQVRISARLIDAVSDDHLWAQDYSSVDVSDVIDLQSRVATAIAQQVSVHITPEEQERLVDVKPAQPQAYEAYLQGRFHFNRRMPADIARALDYFSQAIETDSTFAPAFAGIADCYIVRAMWNWDTSHNTFPRARFACEQALRLDPMLAEAHASRAMVQLFYDWDWDSAETSFKTAIGLNPNYATAYHWYGLSLMSLGRYDAGIRRMQQAVKLDPFAPIMLVSLSQCYDLDGQYDKANEMLDRAFTVFPEFGYAWLAKSWIAFHEKQFAEAADYARTAMRLHVDRSEVMLVAGLDGLGEREQADSVVSKAVARPNQAYHVQAALYAYHGLPDSAMVHAQRAIDRREWFVVAFRSRWLEPMHDHPGFDEMLKTRAPIKGVD